jgi:PIN domain nuclease of toxin-antitoxin system
VGILLDAFALLAFLDDEPAAHDVESLLARGDAAMSAVNLAEAAQKKLRTSSVSLPELQEVTGSLPLAIIPYSEAHAWRASALRARHYRRRDSAVSLADCSLVAVATPADRIATADPAVLAMAEAEGIATFVLPRS